MFSLDIGGIGWLFVVCIAAVVSYLYMTWPYNYFKNRGIPGPKPIPFLGNLGDFGKKPFWSSDVEWTKQYGKVFGMFVFGKKNYMISDREIMREICIKEFDHFCDRSKFPNRGIFKNSVLDANGQRWNDQRHHLSPYFSAGTMKMSAKPINTILDNLISCLEEKCDKGEMIEAKHICRRMTFDVICSTAFGIDVNCCQNPDLDIFKQANKIFDDFGTGNKVIFLCFLFPLLGKLLDILHFDSFDCSYFEKLTRQLVAQRKEQTEKNGHDFVNILLKERKGATTGLTDDEIIANAIFFMLAAYDTTAGTLSFLLYNFAVYTECQEKAFQEIEDAIGNENPTYENVQKLKYLEMCLDECLRLFPLAPRIDRLCVKDTVVKGLHIEKGVAVIVPIWQIHRDPEIWEDPDTFIPERFTPENKKTRDPLSYLPFGAGPRHCIGMRLALLELKMAAVRILTKFKIVRNEKTEVPLQFDPKSLSMVSKNGVWLSLERRC